MKIAIVSPFPPPYGGMSVQAEKLSARLSHEGHSVIAIKANPAFPSRIAELESVKGIRTVVRYVLYMRDLFLLRDADIVHVLAASHFYFFAVVVPAILMARFYKKRVVVNYRGGEAEKFFTKFGLISVPFLKLAHRVVVPSLFLQDVFRKFLDKGVEVLPNLADLERFRFRQRNEMQAVLIVSRQLEPLYNHECILRAFKILKGRHAEAQLWICGSGSEENRLRNLQREMALEGVTFWGEMTHEQLAELYDKADIMVNASRADNFPGAILEAFMCGLPVVTTAVGGIPYMVQDKVNGLLVAPDDSYGMAEAVERLLASRTLAVDLTANARKTAEAYSWPNVRDRLYEFYGYGGQCAR